MKTTGSLLGAIALSLMASVGSAQTASSINFGETVLDSLTPSSETLDDGARYKIFIIPNANGGDSVTVALSSADFNPLVLLLDPNEELIGSNDNGGGGCNAHLVAQIPETGTYFVLVRAAYAAEVGQFELALHDVPMLPTSEERCQGFMGPKGIVTPGDSGMGDILPSDRMLADSTHFHVWVLPMAAGDTVTVDLMSDQFDSTLLLVRGLAELLVGDDDGGAGCNSRLVVAADETRTYRLLVRPAQPGQTGLYMWRATSGALPVIEEPACEMGAPPPPPPPDSH